MARDFDTPGPDDTAVDDTAQQKTWKSEVQKQVRLKYLSHVFKTVPLLYQTMSCKISLT
jgi:hypothetical protein